MQRMTISGYLMIAVGFALLAASMFMLLQALSAYQTQNWSEFLTYGLMAVVGTVLGVSSITKMRQKMAILQHLAVRVLSVVICANCGFKVVRTFSSGDFIPKEVGQCQQCKGSMRVDSIYAEEPKKA